MSKETRATLELRALGLAFSLHTYDYDGDAERIGLQAAEAMGVAPQRVLKTLMAEVDGRPVCVVVPSDSEISMKRLAAAFGGNHRAGGQTGLIAAIASCSITASARARAPREWLIPCT